MKGKLANCGTELLVLRHDAGRNAWRHQITERRVVPATANNIFGRVMAYSVGPSISNIQQTVSVTLSSMIKSAVIKVVLLYHNLLARIQRRYLSRWLCF